MTASKTYNQYVLTQTFSTSSQQLTRAQAVCCIQTSLLWDMHGSWVDSYTSAELGYTVFNTIQVGSRWKIQTRREIKNMRQHIK